MASAARIGALGVVLPGDGAPEQRHDRVADELLDGPAVALELVAQPGVIRRQDGLDVFRIEAFGTRREPDEVAEQDRDDLALLAGGVGGLERRPAHAADPKAVRVRLTTGSTDDRHRRKGTCREAADLVLPFRPGRPSADVARSPVGM